MAAHYLHLHLHVRQGPTSNTHMHAPHTRLLESRPVLGGLIQWLSISTPTPATCHAALPDQFPAGTLLLVLLRLDLHPLFPFSMTPTGGYRSYLHCGTILETVMISVCSQGTNPSYLPRLLSSASKRVKGRPTRKKRASPAGALATLNALTRTSVLTWWHLVQHALHAVFRPEWDHVVANS